MRRPPLRRSSPAPFQRLAAVSKQVELDQLFVQNVAILGHDRPGHLVEQSIGNLKRPLTDAQLNAKFRDQGMLALPAAQVDRLIDLCWRIDTLEDVGELVRAAAPAIVLA